MIFKLNMTYLAVIALLVFYTFIADDTENGFDSQTSYKLATWWLGCLCFVYVLLLLAQMWILL